MESVEISSKMKVDLMMVTCPLLFLPSSATSVSMLRNRKMTGTHEQNNLYNDW